MTNPSPLLALIEDEATAAHALTAQGNRPGAATGQRPPLEPEWLPWGPSSDASGPPMLLATLGSIELEYAAIRRSCGRLDAAHRGTVRLTGDDRLDLLDRLVTQQVCTLKNGDVAEAFLLDRTGRLQSDLVVLHTAEATWLDVDTHQADATAATLEAMCFGEDVAIANVSDVQHRIELHGPQSEAVLGAMGLAVPQPMHVTQDDGTVCWRLDRVGVPGFALCVPAQRSAAMWRGITEAAQQCECSCRTIGWYALNMARVETGEPMANIDYGTGNLPAETGVLHRRVSFTKGCYPGQEVVARMHNLGHPKQVLRSLVLDDDRLPIAGAQIFAGDDADLASPLGAVTSSAPAPLSGSRPAAMGMVRWSIASPGTRVCVMADGEGVGAVVETLATESQP